MIASLRISSGGALAIQTIRAATSSGGNAAVGAGAWRRVVERSTGAHTPKLVAIAPG